MWAHGPVVSSRWCICSEYDLRSESYNEIKLVFLGPKLDDMVIDRDGIRTVSLSMRWRYRLAREELIGEEMAVETSSRIETASNEEVVDGR